MKRLTFWFDPISPYAYLAFEHLPQALEGCSYEVVYRPVLFGGLLKHWGQKGPAEIEPKRAWTFRQVAWHAHSLNIPMATPAQHPFNPLTLLRMVLAAAPTGGTPNRRQVEAVMRHVWRGEGADANAPDRVQALAAELNAARDARGNEVKAELRAHTEAAIAQGVFGVPMVEVDGRHFWGLEAMPMLRAYLLNDPWFGGTSWDEAGRPRPGVTRG